MSSSIIIKFSFSPTRSLFHTQEEESTKAMMHPSIGVQQNSTPTTDHQQVVPTKKAEYTENMAEDHSLTFAQHRRAYAATLILMATIVHVVASVVTVMLYFLLPSSAPLWLVPVGGVGATYLAFLIGALFCYPYFGTGKGASPRSYGLLGTRLCQLRARLDAIKTAKVAPEQSENQEYCRIAYLEAERCYERANWYIHEHRAGWRWVTGLGYINAWGLLHRAEEALIKIEPPEMVFRRAIHDKLALQDSTIARRDELVRKLTRAATDLYPEGTIYFQDDDPDENHELLQKIADAFNQMPSTHPLINPQSSPTSKQQDAARMILSEIRRTLNDFRDNLWERILRERNQLLNTIGVTGLLTHILLCLMIVMMGPRSSTAPYLMAAIAFYMVGAISGLFARFYKEVNLDKAVAVDDFGLSLARLIATPLLSGLAGIGGVIISLSLSTAISSSASSISFRSIFQLGAPSYLLIAAAFGLAPNLIISELQQRTANLSSDLQKSKSVVQERQTD